MLSCTTILTTTTSKLVRVIIPISNLIGKKTNLNQCKNYARASSKGSGNKAHFTLTISRLAIAQTVEVSKLGRLGSSAW